MLSRLAQLSRDSLVYGLGGAVARYTGLLLLPIYTRVFSTSEYGVLESVSNLGTLLLAITMLGLDGAVPLLYFETDDPQERRRICLLWILTAVLITLPVTLLLVAASSWISFAASGTSQNSGLFRLGVAVVPFSILHVVVSNILRLTFRPRAYALLNFSLTTLVAIISISLVVFTGMGLSGALWGILLGSAIVSIAGTYSVRDSLRLGKIDPNLWRLARRLLKLGLPLVPASVALWVISFSNTYFLIQLAGPGDAGVFRVGVRLAALLGLGVWAFQLAWTPFSLSLAKDPQAPRIYSRVALLYTAGAVGVSVLMAALAPALLQVITTADYWRASSVIGLLSLAAASLGAYYVVATGVNLAQRTGQIAWTTILAAALNLALNAVLIPIWGIVGAGLASLAANLTSTTLVYFVSQRVWPLPYEPVKLLIIWLSGSACVLIAAIFNTSVRPSIWLSIASALLLTSLFLSTLFISRVITMGELQKLRGAIAKRTKDEGGLG